ncbi:palmitoyltransferase for Vac8p [Dinochytrium kinnereticum]|nr:palmitoyltransferase for Vac8p [Dinochytrium kinnereticum]
MVVEKRKLDEGEDEKAKEVEPVKKKSSGESEVEPTEAPATDEATGKDATGVKRDANGSGFGGSSLKSNPFFNMFKKGSKDDDWDEWEEEDKKAGPNPPQKPPTTLEKKDTMTMDSPHKVLTSKTAELALNAPKTQPTGEGPVTPPQASTFIPSHGHATPNIFSVDTPSKNIFGGAFAGRDSGIHSSGLSENAKINKAFNMGSTTKASTFGSSFGSSSGFSFASAKAVGSFSDLLSTPSKKTITATEEAEKEDEEEVASEEEVKIGATVVSDATAVEIMRTEGILKLILNVRVIPQMPCSILQEKFVTFASFEDSSTSLTKFLLKVNNGFPRRYLEVGVCYDFIGKWTGILAMIVVFQPLAVVFAFCYYKIIVTDPGSPNSDLLDEAGKSESLTSLDRGEMENDVSLLGERDPPGEADTWGSSVEMKRNGGRRFCRKCHNYKPDRTHHCSTCNRCILKMIDLLFDINWIMLVILSGVFSLCLLAFTAMHTSLLLANKTTIESLEPTKRLRSNGIDDMLNTSSLSTERRLDGPEQHIVRGVNVYDFGNYRNWVQVMGPDWRLWFFPVPTTMSRISFRAGRTLCKNKARRSVSDEQNKFDISRNMELPRIRPHSSMQKQIQVMASAAARLWLAKSAEYISLDNLTEVHHYSGHDVTDSATPTKIDSACKLTRFDQDTIEFNSVEKFGADTFTKAGLRICQDLLREADNRNPDFFQLKGLLSDFRGYGELEVIENQLRVILKHFKNATKKKSPLSAAQESFKAFGTAWVATSENLAALGVLNESHFPSVRTTMAVALALGNQINQRFEEKISQWPEKLWSVWTGDEFEGDRKKKSVEEDEGKKKKDAKKGEVDAEEDYKKKKKRPKRAVKDANAPPWDFEEALLALKADRKQIGGAEFDIAAWSEGPREKSETPSFP